MVGVLTAGCNGTPTASRTTPSPSGGQAEVQSTPPTPSPSATVTPSPGASATAAASPAVHYASRCAVSQLTLAWGGRTSEATQQETLPLILTNGSSSGCHLFGYPGIALVDANGRVLPLQYVWSGDQMVTSSPPVMVELPPGGSAYIVTNKNACETTDLMHGVTVRVIPPDDTASLQVSIVDNVGMDYCGAGDVGSILHISPVEPSLSAAAAS
jgi:hypothetical protein